jgi:antitoxin component of RelBE/YafQ-DinJ toxin-antitoxin module
MKKEYDFSHARPNPYAARSKRSVTIRLDEGTISYFKALAADTGIPYQTLINSYLRECADTRRRPAMRWVKAAATKGAASQRAAPRRAQLPVRSSRSTRRG